jgi:trans-aconitate 2-methyltransferase
VSAEHEKGPFIRAEREQRGVKRNAPVEWDASAYDALADPQEEWARDVVERLDLRGDETVLDAGCGTGRVTRQLLERLPKGRVIGVDGSEEMITTAQAALGDDPRVDLRVGDLLDLELDEPVDAVFSNATFHWISDHGRLFQRLFACLRPGGRLEAQCGGEGNVAEWERAIVAMAGDERFAPYFRDMAQAWNFASVGDTQARLARAGFEIGQVWLEQKRYTPPQPREFLRTCGLAKHLDRLPPDLQEPFVDAIMGSMTRPLTFLYVRLNISARRPD